MVHTIEGGTAIPVRKNMTVKYVQEYGNELQKAVIHMFDYNGDGNIDKKEAKEYNKYNLEKFEIGSVTLFRKNKPSAITLKFGEPSDLQDLTIWNNGVYRRSDGKYITGQALVYDTVKGECTVSNDRGKERYTIDVKS